MKDLLDSSRRDFYTLEEINELAIKYPETLVNNSEYTFRSRVKKVIDYITENKNKCKLVLITGPSSSGKTTFSKILRGELRKLNIWNDIISLDNFYKGFKNVPILEDGSRDFESVEGLDTDEVKKVLKDLIEHGAGNIPLYDFKSMAASGKRLHINVPKEGIIIVEGIHAINPEITDELSDENILKLYIDVEEGVKLKSGEDFIKPEDIRLMRRVGRDYKYRHVLPIRTIMMWRNVRRGEELYLKPLKKYADFTINTFHTYEPCVMGADVISYLNSIPQNLDMDVLKEKLYKFENISEDLVPKDSLIREFI